VLRPTVIGTGDGVLFSPAVLFLSQSGTCARLRHNLVGTSSVLVTTSADDVLMVVGQQTVMAAHVEWSYDLLSRGPAAR
jgi:hypothetical protein